jgi:hypothetical protein
MRVVNPDCNYIFAAVGTDAVRNIIYKLAVTVGAFAQIIAVAPYLAVVIHPLEADRYIRVLSEFREREMPAVPACAAGEIPCAAGMFNIERLSNRPVMREIDFPPAGIVETGLPCLGVVAQKKLPADVQGLRNTGIHKKSS